MEVDGGMGPSSGVDSGLWAPFSRPRGGGKEGQQLRRGLGTPGLQGLR